MDAKLLYRLFDIFYSCRKQPWSHHVCYLSHMTNGCSRDKLRDDNQPIMVMVKSVLLGKLHHVTYVLFNANIQLF